MGFLGAGVDVAGIGFDCPLPARRHRSNGPCLSLEAVTGEIPASPYPWVGIIHKTGADALLHQPQQVEITEESYLLERKVNNKAVKFGRYIDLA